MACSSNSEVDWKNFYTKFPEKVFLYDHQIQKGLFEFCKELYFNKYENSPPLLFLLLLQGTESNPLRERVKLFSSLVFERHVSEIRITLKTSSHSSNSTFNFSKLCLILQILTCRIYDFSKYCVLQRYGFTSLISFVLKQKVLKFDFVISPKRFVSGFLSSDIVKEPVS